MCPKVAIGCLGQEFDQLDTPAHPHLAALVNGDGEGVLGVVPGAPVAEAPQFPILRAVNGDGFCGPPKNFFEEHSCEKGVRVVWKKRRVENDEAAVGAMNVLCDIEVS